MPEFGSTGAFGGASGAKLSEDERDRVSRRLANLTNDPVRIDFGDPDVLAFTDRQRGRLTDDNGIPIRKDFEPFTPTVKRSDAWPESSVGEGEPNPPLSVFNTKKLLNNSGFHDFQPGIEQMGEATPRFLADLGRFQATHDLKPDRKVHPGGPTVHMLTLNAFGPGEGPPPSVESELFKERFGRDPNRTLSGQPIFGPGSVAETLGAAAKTSARADSLVPVEFPLEPGSGLPVEKKRPAPKGRARPLTGARLPTDPAPAFSKEASQRAADHRELSPVELSRVTNALKRGSPYQRAQAIAYLQRVALSSPAMLAKLRAQLPGLTDNAESIWVRIEHFKITRSDAARLGLHNVIHAIDQLDNYRNLSIAQKRNLRIFIENLNRKHPSDIVAGRLDSLRRRLARDKEAKPPITDDDLVRVVMEGVPPIPAPIIAMPFTEGMRYAAKKTNKQEFRRRLDNPITRRSIERAYSRWNEIEKNFRKQE
jgi:hypothetical protein